MFRKKGTPNQLYDAVDARVLVVGRGTAPEGDRYVYSVVKEDRRDETYLLKNTGYIALDGVEDSPPNQHANEEDIRFTVTKDELETDFVKI